MKLDRKLQRELLEQLANEYPAQVTLDPEKQDDPIIVANLWYLEEHGLVECLKAEYLDDGACVAAARVTAAGMDFLADDGGLRAVLGTVTVKLHADTLRDLIESRIASADLPANEKETLTDHLRKLPAEALKKVATRLLDEAVSHLPDAIPLLRQLLGF